MQRRGNAVYDRSVGLITEFVRGIRDVKNLSIRKNAEDKFKQNIVYQKNAVVDRVVGNNTWRKSRRILERITEFGFTAFGIYLVTQGQIGIGSFEKLQRVCFALQN